MLDIFLFSIGALTVAFGFVAFFGAPYVPTLAEQIKDIDSAYKFSKNDLFVDLGSGDGVVLRSIGPKVKGAVGYELSPWFFIFSKMLCLKYPNIKIYCKNYWTIQLPPETTVVYTFLSSRYMKKLDAKMQQHANRHGKAITLISYSFQIPDKKYDKVSGPMYVYKFMPRLQT